MARGGWLILLVALTAARVADAAADCDEGRALTGLGVAVRSGALAVADVAPGSAAARAGFRTDDVLVQVNDVLPRSCGQWARAVTAARNERKALLVLVRRGAAEIPLALGSTTWGAPEPAPAGAPPPGGAPPPVAAPTVAPPPPPPPPLPPETAVSVEGIVRDIAALAPPDSPPSSLPAYRDAVLHARREVETLAARKSAPDETIAELRSVLRYYEGAVVAWDAIESHREHEGVSRRMPTPENMAVPYFSNSPVASLLDEFDFLDATISRSPSGAWLAESSGLWRPVWARLLLWERGARALDTLRARLHIAS